MEREYGETYFVPLMVTGMALVARLSALARMVREEDAPRARRKLDLDGKTDQRGVSVI